jgi:hypothetical protein
MQPQEDLGADKVPGIILAKMDAAFGQSEMPQNGSRHPF